MICATCGEPDIEGPCPSCGTVAIKELPLRGGTSDKAVDGFAGE